MHKKIIPAFVAFLFLLPISSRLVLGQSLAEVAKKERERQAKILQKEKIPSFTNTDLKNLPGGAGSSEAQSGPAPAAAGPADQKKDQGKRPPLGVALDDKGRDETYWRNAMSKARAQVAELEAKAQQLSGMSARLSSDSVNIDDPGQQNLARQNREKSFQDLAKAQDQLRQARQDLQNLQEDGRRSGALPGWLR